MFGYIRNLVANHATKLHQKIRRFASKNLWYVLAAVALVFFLAGVALGSEKTVQPEIDNSYVEGPSVEVQCQDGREFSYSAHLNAIPEATDAWVVYKWAGGDDGFLWMKFKIENGQGILQWIVIRDDDGYQKYSNLEEAYKKYPTVCSIPSNAPEKRADADPGFLWPTGGYCLRCNKKT